MLAYAFIILKLPIPTMKSVNVSAEELLQIAERVGKLKLRRLPFSLCASGFLITDGVHTVWLTRTHPDLTRAIARAMAQITGEKNYIYCMPFAKHTAKIIRNRLHELPFIEVTENGYN